jgi:outer membrane lipoprotein carrier protein
MKKLSVLFALAFLSFGMVSAQTTSSKTTVNDPKAKMLLDKVKKMYESYSGLETNFEMSVKLPEQKKDDVQKGKIYQQGDKYRAEVGKQLFISDGQTVWQKIDNTVIIKKANNKNSSELLSPRDLIKIYENKEYSYAIQNEEAEGWSKKATIIVFKPNNRRNEFTQIRVAIDQKTNQVVSLTASGRDQSRMKLSLDVPVVNKTYPTTYFVFDKSKYPNVQVEDTREN